MPTLTLVRNDQKFYLEFEVRDALGAIVDITGCSIGFKMQKYNEGTLTIDKAGTVTNGTLGLCQVFIDQEIVGEKEGEYQAELEVRWLATEQILTAPNIVVKVLKDLPK